MANVLNRTTKEYRPSVNTPDFPESDWIINPDLSAVEGQPSKYWKIDGDTVTLMDDIERTIVDAVETTAIDDAAVAAKAAAEAAAVKAVTDGAKEPSPVAAATLEERVRALELKVYGV